MTDLGDRPTPRSEPGEPAPGGVDAIHDVLYETEPVVPDLASALHPDLEVPEPVAEGEDTDRASSDGASEPEKESPA